MRWIPDRPSDGYVSQLGQDRWVLSLPRTSPGFFVELGASDGLRLSNTVSLERSGWTGLCIEPSHEFDLLTQNRACLTSNALVSSESGHEVEFFVDSADPHFSGVTSELRSQRIEGERRVLTTSTLTEVLDSVNAPSRIDYLSLDTEGTEVEVLRGLDFGRYQIAAATIEHNFHQDRRDEICRIMRSAGLVRVHHRLFDDWFLNTSVYRKHTISREFARGLAFTALRGYRKVSRTLRTPRR